MLFSNNSAPPVCELAHDRFLGVLITGVSPKFFEVLDFSQQFGVCLQGSRAILEASFLGSCSDGGRHVLEAIPFLQPRLVDVVMNCKVILLRVGRFPTDGFRSELVIAFGFGLIPNVTDYMYMFTGHDVTIQVAVSNPSFGQDVRSRAAWKCLAQHYNMCVPGRP